MITKLKRHKVLFIILLVVIIAAVVGSILFINLRPSAGVNEANRKKNVITLGKQDLTKSISATGTVESADSKTVSANVNNLTIKKVKVKVGDEVNKGDTLVTFDKSDLSDALTDAKENLTTVKADASRSISSARQQLSDANETYTSEKSKSAKEVSKAKKTLTKAKKEVASLKKKVKAAKNAAKKKELQEQLTKAQEALTQAQTSYDNAVSSQESSLRQNKSSIQNAQNSVDNAISSGDKSIKEAESQVEDAEKALKDCAVTAPISGIVTAVNVEDGDTYSGGDMFQIDDTSSFTVTTTVDEYDISNVSVGQRAVILTEATDKEEIQGKITFVAPSTSSTSSSSSSSSGEGGGTTMTSTSSSDGYEVIIDITDSNEKLKMGLTAKCSLILEEATDVFAVPYDAIHKNNNGDNVIYVTEDENNTDKYEEVTVTKGMESDYYVEIKGDALEEGMFVIIPTDETEEASDNDSSEQNGFGFGGNQNMPGGGGDMNRGNRSSKSGNGGGNPPAAPGN